MYEKVKKSQNLDRLEKFDHYQSGLLLRIERLKKAKGIMDDSICD